MKEIGGYEVLDIMFEELNIESCSIYDINMWGKDYNDKYPNVYVDTTRDTMMSIPAWWYYWDNKVERFYKQNSLKCPICDDIHYKYPENDKYKKLEKYYKIHKLHEKTNGKVKTIE
jgi:hypothetical protein